MKKHERRRALLRVPRLLGEVLLGGRYSFVYDRIPITTRSLSVGKRMNLLRSGGNLIHRRLRPWSMPLHMQFELASVCDLRCPVCPAGRREVARDVSFMAPELFASVMAEVGPYLLTSSLWGWGEPLLHPQLDEILRIAERFPVANLLSTNGQRLARPDVQAALRRHPPAQLIVALDGITDESNSHFRVGAVLAPALDGVRQLAEWKRQTGAEVPVLHMRFIVMKHNQHELPQVDQFARAHGFDVLSLRTLSIIDALEPDQMVKGLLPDAREFRAYAYDADGRRRESDFVCQEPFWFPTLFADGTVVACDQDCNARLPFGRVDSSTSFRTVWHSRQAARVRRQIRDQAHTISFCRNCPYADRADSDCSVELHELRSQP